MIVSSRLHGMFSRTDLDPEIHVTVDRKRFAGPEAAFRHITARRAVSELMRLLGVNRKSLERRIRRIRKADRR